MGCCVSSDDDSANQHLQPSQHHYHHNNQQFMSLDDARKRRQSSMGVGMGVTMMMQQAGALVGAAPIPDPAAIQAQIRKAKAEGRTVTMVNGALYFDYQLVARIPPHYDIRL